MSRNPDLPTGKEERIGYLKQRYENSDPTLSESHVITLLHKETGISERTLYSYKKKFEWVRAKVESPNIRKETRNQPKTLRGVTELELAAKTFLGRSRADLDWQAHYPEKGVEISDEEKLTWIKRIGKEYFLTGNNPFTICQERGVDFSDFVEWTTENANCKEVWRAFHTQRTAWVVDFMQAYCFDLVKNSLTGEMPPIISETFIWVKDGTNGGGSYEPRSKTVTTAPRPNPAQVIDIMTKVSEWADKQQRNQANKLTDAKALKTLGEIREQIEIIKEQLADDESGIEGGPTE